MFGDNDHEVGDDDDSASSPLSFKNKSSLNINEKLIVYLTNERKMIGINFANCEHLAV